MRDQKGITLIALVITIIILLILAGVSINLLIGEEGILGKTQGSVKATKKAVAEEQVYLAWSSAQTDYYSDWTRDININDADYFHASKLTNYVSQGEIVDVKYKMNTDGDSIVTYKDDSNTPVYYTVTIKRNGQVLADNNATVIPPAMEPTTPGVDNLEELAKATKSKRNAIDAIEMIQTAEGGLREMNSILQRLFELATHTANGTSEDREAITKEMKQLVQEIDRLSSTIQYKSITLLDGSISDSSGWKVELAERTLVISIAQINSSVLGVSSVDVSSEASAIVYTDKVRMALDFISSERAKLGGRQNQLEYIVDYYDTIEGILGNNLAESDTMKQIASVGATEILGMLNRIDILTSQVTNATKDSFAKNSSLFEALLLKEGIGILSEDVGYKGQKLLNGSYSNIPSLSFAELYVDYMTDEDVQRTKTECESAIAKVEAVINKIK